MDISGFLVLALGVLGLCLGSFANAAVWRIKKRKDLVRDRSECTKCHKKLEWYDLIPVVSWLSLGGKCRYCKKPISIQYPLVELAVAAFFVVSYLIWPYDLASVLDYTVLALWLASGVGLAILFVYDLRWFLLPDVVVFPLIAIGAIMALLRVVSSPGPLMAIIDVLLAVLVLAGLYYVLYKLSKGRWVGFGDVKLAVFLGLALSDWRLALLALFLANFIGTLVVIPGLLRGTLSRTTHIPFGPFLIAGFVLAGLLGYPIINWYLSLTFAALAL